MGDVEHGEEIEEGEGGGGQQPPCPQPEMRPKFFFGKGSVMLRFLTPFFLSFDIINRLVIYRQLYFLEVLSFFPTDYDK